MINLKKEKIKRVIAFLVGIVISVAALYYLCRDIDFERFKKEFSNLQLWVAFPLFLLFIASLYIRALRWRLLLPASLRENLGDRELMDSALIGFSANAVLPLRAGEIVRPLFLKKLTGVPFTSGLTSIFTERVFDLLSLLVVAFFALATVKDPPAFLIITSRGLGLIAGIGVVGIILCTFFGSWTLSLADKLGGRILPENLKGKVLGILRHVIEALSALRTCKDIFLVLVYSFAIWLLAALYYQLSLHLFGESVGFIGGVLLAVTIAFAVAAPSSPGFLGTYQFGCALTLSHILDFSNEFSLAYGLTVHLVQTGSMLLFALVVLWKRGIGISYALEQKA